MATFTIDWSLENSTSHINYKLYYRVAGTSLWTTLFTTANSYVLHGLTNNYIYDVQVQNINNFDNPTSLLMQAIGITDPLPILSPTNNTVAYSFTNLSYFMTSYTVTIALTSTPGTIIQTQEHSATDTITGILTGLSNSTAYTISITPVANQFSATFTYHITTAESATCAPATSVSASLLYSAISVVPVRLIVTWQSPVISPAQGYILAYRRKGDPDYTIQFTSGMTSGNTATAPVDALVNYEGYLQANCGDGTISANIPFGANSYIIPTVSVAMQINPLKYIATVTSSFPNPYDTLMTGHFTSSIAGTVNYSLTYSAGNTTEDIVLANSAVSANEVISAVVLSTAVAVFDNGGSLQQFDSVSTPSYFKFITSGTPWNGNPAKLASFTLDEFTPTEADVSSNILAGTLNMSWIYDTVYLGGTSPYNTVVFEIRDPAGNALMGTCTTFTGTLGVNNTSIHITKQTTAITDTNSFNLVSMWSDGTVFDTISFYLPDF